MPNMPSNNVSFHKSSESYSLWRGSGLVKMELNLGFLGVYNNPWNSEMIYDVDDGWLALWLQYATLVP